MTWILLSLLYAVTNAVYTTYNETRNFNGYVLGIWRGFGISLLVAPLLFTVPPVTSASYYLILVIQGLMIGIYDSHLFFASGKYGSHASSGFMATCVLITVFLWWGIDFSELAALMHTPSRLITLMLILSGFSVSYWQMMKVRVSRRRRRIPLPRRLRPRIDEHCHAVYCPQRRYRLCRCRLLPYGRLLCQRRLQCRDVRPPENTPSAATTVIPAARPPAPDSRFAGEHLCGSLQTGTAARPAAALAGAHGSLPSVRC